MHSPPGRCAHGDAGDAEARAAAAAGDDEVERLPGGEPDDGRQDASAVEEPAAEGVEVVPVVFVGEEDGVDGGQLGEGQGGGGAVFEDGDAGVVLGAGGGELWVLSWLFFFFFLEGDGGAGRAYEGVGEEVDVVDGEDGGGSADVRDADGAFEAGRRHSRGIV